MIRKIERVLLLLCLAGLAGVFLCIVLPAWECVIHSPYVVSLFSSNVRSGPSTEHPIIAGLPKGKAANILARTGIASGWLYIELADHKRGYISSQVVEISGNLSCVEQTIAPHSESSSATTVATVAPTEEPTSAAATSEPSRVPAASATTPRDYCIKRQTCDDMANCEEARRYYRYCGRNDLDGDNDGIPCENICD